MTANPILYLECQLRHHLHMTGAEIKALTDDEFVKYVAIMQDIRKEESKRQQI